MAGECDELDAVRTECNQSTQDPIRMPTTSVRVVLKMGKATKKKNINKPTAIELPKIAMRVT